jgi:transcriptional regulator with XRE-family HTH domain
MKATDFPKITLEAARVNAKLSQKEAARLLNVDASTLRNYEHGKSAPSYTLVKKMESLYRFPSDFIFFGT